MLHAPVVQDVAQAGAQAVAGEVQPHALVLYRAAPGALASPQGVKQMAQIGCGPALAFAQALFELGAQLFDFPGRHRLGAGAKDAINVLDGLRQPCGWQWARLDWGVAGVGMAQVELQSPTLLGVVQTHTVHLQGAHFGERCHQLHRGVLAHFGG